MSADPFARPDPSASSEPACTRHVIAEGPDWREYSNGDVQYDPPNFGLKPEGAAPAPGRDYVADPLVGGGYRKRPAVVWDAARADYLAGVSAPDVCKRYGLKLGTLKHRMAADGWRRADQPAPDPEDIVVYDDELDLDAYADADDWDMAESCRRRMARAVYNGQATEALRWRRLAEMFEADARKLDTLIAEAKAWDAAHGVGRSDPAPDLESEPEPEAEAAPDSDDSDYSDPVFRAPVSPLPSRTANRPNFATAGPASSRTCAPPS